LAVESATLIVALVATGARRVFIVWAVVVVTIGIITGLTNAASGSADLDKAVSTISILLILVAPVALVRAVIVRRKVDLETVLAALCLYVMLGLFFGFLFSGIQTFSGNQFFVQSGRGSSSDFLYYSFATMTTVGYGDLTAASAPGRTLSVAEAMLGQLYLVTVVAVLVSNLKPRSRAVTSKGSTTAPMSQPMRIGLGRVAPMEDPSAELTQLTRRLDDVEAAMERLDQATYGRCDHCGSEIEPDLLEGDPTETRCSSCANSTTAT
jgi:hypothetical protein